MRRVPFAALALTVAAALFATGQRAGADGESPPAAPATAPDVRDVGALVEAARASRGIPGMVAVTLAGDRIVACGAAGVRRVGSPEPITADDRMHLGSCTKAMTATLCAMLVRDGKLAWDAKPAATFAKDVKPVDPGWRDATLEMLLRNRGGAPHTLDAGGLWDRLWKHPGPPTAARMALVEGVLGRAPASAPGTTYAYSNAGFSIAGAMAERATGEPWEDLLRKRVFEPLGATSLGLGAPGNPGTVDQPRGHRDDGTPVDPGPGDDNPDAIGPAGKVHLSLGDWAKFVALHLHDGRGAPEPFAKIDWAKLHAAVPGTGGAPDYAMGWIVVERPWAKGKAKGSRGRVLTHSGSNTMWYCVAWLAPERDFAVLVAANRGGEAATKACDDVSSALIREHLATLAPPERR